MATDNHIDFTVRVKNEGLGELAGDLSKVEEGAKGLGAAGEAAGSALGKLDAEAKQAGADVGALAQAQDGAAKQGAELGQAATQGAKGVQGMGRGASQAGSELAELGQAVAAKTAAIKSGLLVEQSEIELQRQHLTAAAAEQQARLRAAQAQGDEAAATRAGNALRQTELDQLRLTAQGKRAEATAVQQATDARRELLAAVGPLTAAQQRELQAAENHAKALRVQAAAADQAAQEAQDLGKALDDTAVRSTALGGALTQVAKAVGGLFAASKVWDFAKDTIAVADAYGQMAERIQMATGNSGEYDLVQRRILESANLTYRALSEQQELYIQTADALRSMSYSTAEVLDITDSFSYLLTTNAASAERGKNAIDAYTKSIQSGRIEVDSWQSIMAATPTVVDAIASATGKTAEEVRRLGITGQLSIADLNEGLRQTVELNKSAAAGMSATVKDAVTRLANTWSVYVGEANRAHQSTEKIVWLIDQLSKNLDSVVALAVTAGEVMVAVWGVKALNALKAYTAQLSLAAVETTSLMAATTAAGAKMAAGLAAAGKLAAAAWIGWEIGAFLRDEFEVVEQAGIALAAGLTKTAARAQAAWEMVKATWSADTIEAAQERLREKLQAIDDEYAALFAAADRAGSKQQEVGQKVAAAGAAAQNATVQWEKLRKDYELINQELEVQAKRVDKVATLKNAEAGAAVTMAQALGTESEQRAAQARAAATQAEQLANIAAQRQVELNVLIAERDALLAVGEELIRTNPERKKQLDDLDRQIGLRQADAGAALAQAVGAKAVAIAAQAEAEAHKDNSARVSELRDAYERARAKVEELRAAKAAGKATTEQVTQAEMAAGRAALLYRDALQDQLKAIEAKRNLAQASIDVQSMEVRLAIEQQRTIMEVARARGDEKTAIQAQENIRRLEIQLLLLTAEAKRAEADAAIASAQAKRAELIASGEYHGAKKLEIDAAIKGAEVKRMEGQIAQETANRLRQLGDAQRSLKDKTEDATGSLLKQAAALERLGDGVQRVGEGFRNKDGFTSDAQGNVQQQFVWNRAAIIDYLKQAGMDELLAERLAKQFHNADGSVDYEASAAQIKWGGKFGTLAEALGKMVDYYKHNQSGKHEAAQMLDYERTNAGLNKPAAAPTRSAPASAPEAVRERERSGTSGMSTGASYVSNITIDGRQRSVRYADRSSQLAGDALIRELAQAKGVSQ